MTTTPRVACCVTGQMRGYHLSRLNWRHASYVNEMFAGSERVEWFLVTPNTTSFRWFTEQVASEGGGFLRTHVSIGCHRYVRSNETWGWRDAGDALEFNINRFPHMHASLLGTLLVQQWQLWKCREMLLEQEVRSGIRYDRIVRLRTDVAFGTPENQTRQASTWFATLRRPLRTHWTVLNDWVMVGSRQAMIDVFLDGLSHILHVARLQGLQRIWTELRRIAIQHFAGAIDVYLCANDHSAEHGCGVDIDLVRSVGPPRKLFFMLESEVRHATSCVERRLGSAQCWRHFADAWLLWPMQLDGLNFTYDWWPAHCMDSSKDSLLSCIKRWHIGSFSARNLIGDPTHWHGHASTPGYAWAASNNSCAARDGWENDGR